MSLEEDARQARANAHGAMGAVENAKQRGLELHDQIMERLDALGQAIDSLPVDRALREAVRVLNVDWHNRSERPCGTCRAVSAALGEPFGCEVRAIERAKKKSNP